MKFPFVSRSLSVAAKALTPLVAIAFIFQLVLSPANATELAAANTKAVVVEDDPMWPDLKSELYEDRKINEDAKWLEMVAPYRAHDAALVPITIKAKLPNKAQHIKKLTLVIDNNPVPVAANIELSEKLGPLHMETRLRINQYSYVRAIVETSAGELFMVSKYVKAAGGCSAPAMKDIDATIASIGKMKMRQFSSAKIEPESKQSKINTREVQFMVRHPNYSGMQLNQVTGYYIPAHFVSEIAVKLDGEPLMKIDGAISLSEDPMIRFRFQSENEAPVLDFLVEDTKKQQFKNQWQLKPAEKAGS